MKRQKEIPQTIDFNYIKTPSYRTYYANGIFGGLTSRGELYLELFTERNVTPKIIKYEVTDEGKLGKEIKREGLQGMVREIECGLLINIDTAKSLVEWLNKNIKLCENINNPSNEENDKNG
ncbi:MAG: hypothetical protein ABII74_09465 [Elusimicrobiota bacterium]